MYEIIFYKDNNKSGLEEYINQLGEKRNTSKDAKIKFVKITNYIDKLSKYGTDLGMPFVKHIEDNIWELRPLRDRIMYAYVKKNKILLLNYFVKKSQKTPKDEIKRAKRYLNNYLRRKENEE